MDYYHNAHQVPWSARLMFYLWQAPRWVALPASADHTFLLPPLTGDSVRLGLQHGREPLTPVTLSTRGLVYEAHLTFGFIDRAHLTEYVRITAEWELVGEVLQTLDLTALRRAKKVVDLRYVILVPRVNGDGMVFTITHSVFYRKPL